MKIFVHVQIRAEFQLVLCQKLQYIALMVISRECCVQDFVIVTKLSIKLSSACSYTINTWT